MIPRRFSRQTTLVLMLFTAYTSFVFHDEIAATLTHIDGTIIQPHAAMISTTLLSIMGLGTLGLGCWGVYVWKENWFRKHLPARLAFQWMMFWALVGCGCHAIFIRPWDTFVFLAFLWWVSAYVLLLGLADFYAKRKVL